MPAHTSSTSQSQRMFLPICDDTRCVRAGSHRTPFSHDERRPPRGTSLEPARTKSSSSITRANARKGLCSRLLAQTLYLWQHAARATELDMRYAWCAPRKWKPRLGEQSWIPKRWKFHLPGEHRRDCMGRHCAFCVEQPDTGFVRAGTTKVHFGCLRSSRINGGLRETARRAQVPEMDFA